MHCVCKPGFAHRTCMHTCLRDHVFNCWAGAENAPDTPRPPAAEAPLPRGAGLLPDLPLWRVQWATLPGTQETLLRFQQQRLQTRNKEPTMTLQSMICFQTCGAAHVGIHLHVKHAHARP